jgi:hypothetical protein
MNGLHVTVAWAGSGYSSGPMYAGSAMVQEPQHDAVTFMSFDPQHPHPPHYPAETLHFEPAGGYALIGVGLLVGGAALVRRAYQGFSFIPRPP